MKPHRSSLVCCVVVLAFVASLAPAAAAGQSAPASVVERSLWDRVRAGGQVRALVYLRGTVDWTPAYRMADRVERGRFVYEQLRNAARSSRDLYAWLETAGARPHRLLTANAIAADVDAGLLRTLATRPEVARVGPNGMARLIEPSSPTPGSPGLSAAAVADSVEWNVAKIRADEAWATFGVRGEGIVVGDIGTGVQYLHAALVEQYRGNQGDGTFNHNYNWFDIVNGQPVPYDDNSHSTFGVGVAVGSDGDVNQIGVAPGAKWIAVKAFDSGGSGTYEDLHAALEWMLAPTDLGGDNPDPAKAPNIGLNMWGIGGACNPEFDLDVQAWQAAGMLPVFAIGGEGPGCGLTRSPADMVGTFAAGATDSDDNISGFSARGPGCYGAIKPEVSAPGVSIRSSTNDGGYQVWSGTSFSAAHLAGAAALVLSADPSLAMDELITLVEGTAVCRQDLMCGGTSCPGGMNNVYGAGRIDAYEAVAAALGDLAPMHVGGIKLRVRDLGLGRYVLQGAVKVVDQANLPVVEAAVSVEWTYPSGSTLAQEVVSAHAGVSKFRIKSRQAGLHQLCVTGISKAGWSYDPDQNVETCDAATVP
jgi:subtilisin family serine protease